MPNQNQQNMVSNHYVSQTTATNSYLYDATRTKAESIRKKIQSKSVSIERAPAALMVSTLVFFPLSVISTTFQACHSKSVFSAVRTGTRYYVVCRLQTALSYRTLGKKHECWSTCHYAKHSAKHVMKSELSRYIVDV